MPTSKDLLKHLQLKTIISARFVLDHAGYQFLHMVLDDGTDVRAWEAGQAGEMRMMIDGNELEPEDNNRS